jgi:hypothetical protein
MYIGDSVIAIPFLLIVKTNGHGVTTEKQIRVQR